MYTFIYIIFIHFHLPYLKTFLFIWRLLCSVTVIFLLHLLFLPSSAFISFHSLLFILASSTFHIHLSLSQYPFLHTVIFIWPSLTSWKLNFTFVNLHSLLSMFSDLHVFSFVLTQLNYPDITILLPLHCIFRHLYLLIFILFGQMVCLDVNLFSSNYPHQQFPSKIRHPVHTSFLFLRDESGILRKSLAIEGVFPCFDCNLFNILNILKGLQWLFVTILFLIPSMISGTKVITCS